MILARARQRFVGAANTRRAFDLAAEHQRGFQLRAVASFEDALGPARLDRDQDTRAAIVDQVRVAGRRIGTEQAHGDRAQRHHRLIHA